MDTSAQEKKWRSGRIAMVIPPEGSGPDAEGYHPTCEDPAGRNCEERLETDQDSFQTDAAPIGWTLTEPLESKSPIADSEFLVNLIKEVTKEGCRRQWEDIAFRLNAEDNVACDGEKCKRWWKDFVLELQNGSVTDEDVLEEWKLFQKECVPDVNETYAATTERALPSEQGIGTFQATAAVTPANLQPPVPAGSDYFSLGLNPDTMNQQPFREMSTLCESSKFSELQGHLKILKTQFSKVSGQLSNNTMSLLTLKKDMGNNRKPLSTNLGTVASVIDCNMAIGKQISEIQRTVATIKDWYENYISEGY